MRILFHIRQLLVVASTGWTGLTATAQTKPVVQYVNPFIGTTQSAVLTWWGSEGGTYPGAVAPFGAVQLTPETRLLPAKEYDYRDKTIRFFSCFHHLSGYPHGSSGQVTVMPVRATGDFRPDMYQRPFSHQTEQAEPGYYRVRFTDDQTLVEATATERVGRFRFTFPAGVVPQLFVGDAGEITEISGQEFRGTRGNTLFLFSQPATRREKREGGWLLTFDRAATGPTELQLDLSASDVGFASARRNIDVERAALSFEQTRRQTSWKWVDHLSVVQIDDPNEANKPIFYTALYHSLLLPWIISDVDGQYVGRDKKIYKTSGQHEYGGFSPWDTFRTLHPLLCLLFPDRQTDMVRSMLDIYQQTGHLPGDPMTGNHAIPILVDSYQKGIQLDSGLAYKAMRATILDSLRPNQDLTAYRQLGYVPAVFSESVTKTVEYAYDDWALAQFALQVRHDEAIYTKLLSASYSYRHLLYPASLFMLPRHGATFNVVPGTSGYKEGDSWVYSYFVPQHPADLVNLMGGNRAFVNRLDSALNNQFILFDNETVFHLPYLFNYGGNPAKTQHWVRQIMTTRFLNTPGGLPGNDDLGSISSWYVFSALGLFPMAPGRPVYTVGSPIFQSVTLRLAKQRTLVIRSRQSAPKNAFVQSLMVNGQPEHHYELAHALLQRGGELRFDMGPKPARQPPLYQPLTDAAETVPVAIQVSQVSLSKKTVVPDERCWVRFTLTNRGGLGTQAVQLLIDGHQYTRKNCLVAPGLPVRDSVACRLYAIGPHTVQLANLAPVQITVVRSKQPLDSLRITELAAQSISRVGQPLAISYLVQNISGYRRTFRIPVRLNDSLVYTDPVTLTPGQTRTIHHTLIVRRVGLSFVRVHQAQKPIKVYHISTESTVLDLPLTDTVGDSLMTDHSGFSNHGRIVARRPSRPFAFGDSSYVVIPSSASLDQLDTTLTMMTWVFPIRAEAGLTDLLTKGDNHVLQVSGTNLTFFAGGWGRGECSAALPADWLNHWHHIAGVCEGARLVLYIDGVQAGSTPLDDRASLSVLPRWQLGRNEEFPGERIFHGRLRNVKVLAEPLTASEIKTIVAESR